MRFQFFTAASAKGTAYWYPNVGGTKLLWNFGLLLRDFTKQNPRRLFSECLQRWYYISLDFNLRLLKAFIKPVNKPQSLYGWNFPHRQVHRKKYVPVGPVDWVVLDLPVDLVTKKHLSLKPCDFYDFLRALNRRWITSNKKELERKVCPSQKLNRTAHSS
jgi:hypothetical protein